MKVKLVVLFVLLGFLFYLNHEKFQSNLSVVRYGIDQETLGLSRASLRTPIELHPIDKELFKQATKSQPLLISFASSHSERDILVFATKDYRLVYYDLTHSQLWAQSQRLKGEVLGTPIYDPLRKLIYVKTSHDADEIQTLYAFDEKGRMRFQRSYGLSHLYSHFLKRDITPKDMKVWCKTSLSLMEGSLLFGCSVKSQVYDLNKKLDLYATKRGISGAIVQIPIGDNRFEHPKIFFTAASTEAKESGFDGGVYLSGARIPESSGYAYASIGNAYFDGVKNFGCSILKLEESLKLDNVFSAPTSECHSLNADFTSSAPVIWNTEEGKYLALVDKAGQLHLFNTNDFQKNYHFQVSTLPHYAHGTVSGQSYVTHWYRPQDNDRDFHYATVLSGHVDFLKEKGFEVDKCLGSVSNKKEMAWDLFYSGRIRENYLSLPVNSMTKELLKSKRPSFIKENLPYRYPTKGFWPKYQSLSHPLLLDEEKKSGGQANLYTLDDGELSFFLLGHPQRIKTDTSLSELERTPLQDTFISKSCRGKNRVFLMKKKVPVFKGHGIKIFKMSKRGPYKAKELVFTEDIGLIKNGLVSLKVDGLDAILSVVPLSAGGSLLRVIVLESGKVLLEEKLSPQMHFSMPLITSRYLVLAYKGAGIEVFRLGSKTTSKDF